MSPGDVPVVEKILLPLGYYLLLVVGLALCLYLFVLLKCEIRKLETRWTRRHQALEETIRKMQADIEDARTRLREAEERAGVLVPPVPPRSGLNLNKRTQALRMFARGSSPEQIAAALTLPENEVQLLLKVQRVLTEPAQAG